MELIFVPSSAVVQNPGSWAITEKCTLIAQLVFKLVFAFLGILL